LVNLPVGGTPAEIKARDKEAKDKEKEIATSQTALNTLLMAEQRALQLKVTIDGQMAGEFSVFFYGESILLKHIFASC
jgi:hypothetical protein